MRPNGYWRGFGRDRRRPNPLIIVWRWRRELTLLVGLPWVLHELAVATSPLVAALPVVAVAATCGVWPPARRRLVAYLRAVAMEHRLRVGMVQAGIVSYGGWIPATLITRCRPRGVRITVWCPAGVTVEDFQEARSTLAAACWAADVEVTNHQRHAHIVVVQIVTRPGYWR